LDSNRVVWSPILGKRLRCADFDAFDGWVRRSRAGWLRPQRSRGGRDGDSVPPRSGRSIEAFDSGNLGLEQDSDRRKSEMPSRRGQEISRGHDSVTVPQECVQGHGSQAQGVERKVNVATFLKDTACGNRMALLWGPIR
jgi:hypothetical protein